MKNYLVCAALLPLICSSAMAQIQHAGQPLHWGESLPTVAYKTFPALDLDVLSAEDAVTASMKDAPWRF